jgi:hypothetical protein
MSRSRLSNANSMVCLVVGACSSYWASRHLGLETRVLKLLKSFSEDVVSLQELCCTDWRLSLSSHGKQVLKSCCATSRS